MAAARSATLEARVEKAARLLPVALHGALGHAERLVSFVHGLDAGADDGEADAIVRAIAGLGRSLGIATTAEGVETVAQLNALVADGCTEMQGYLFSPPRPAAEIARLLAVSQSWPTVAAAQPKAAMV